MSLLVLGLSHHTAPLPLLEAVALDDAACAALAADAFSRDNLQEVVVVSTCNRTEVYAEASTFHGAITDVSEALTSVTGVALEELMDHLYVHYEDRAIAHAFTVACGLDSMAIGEAQILGQMRHALRTGQRSDQVGPALNTLFQQALRVGKRAHAETGIDTVSVSFVEAGLARAAEVLGPLTGQRVLVVGAGGMSSLASTTVARLGCADLVVLNRTWERGRRLADRVGGKARPFEDLGAALAEADLVISCTGSTGVVVSLAEAADAQVARNGRRQMYVDLALPHDIAPEVSSLSSVVVAGLGALGSDLSDGTTSPAVEQVGDLVVSEVAAFLTSRAAESVAPTVAALRTAARGVVDRELSRLDQRLPELDGATREEVHLAVHRVVEKLLHTPTVRMKQLASDGGADYARALRELFDLDPREALAVAVPPSVPVTPGGSR